MISIGVQQILDGSQVIAILYMVLLQMVPTTIMFEGIPNLSRYFKMVANRIDKHKVNIFYTAPTALRALNERRC